MAGWRKTMKEAVGDLDTSAKGKAEAKSIADRYSKTAPFTAEQKTQIKEAIKRRSMQGIRELGSGPSPKAKSRYADKTVSR